MNVAQAISASNARFGGGGYFLVINWISTGFTIMVLCLCLTELLEWGSTLSGIGGKRILASRDLKMGKLAVKKVTESD